VALPSSLTPVAAGDRTFANIARIVFLGSVVAALAPSPESIVTD
jgi:hypothetical protein